MGVSGFTAVNLISISAILAVTQRRPFGEVIRAEGGTSLAIIGVDCSSIGIVAVSQYLDRPALVPFVLAPTLAVHLAFRGWVKQKELFQRMKDEKTKGYASLLLRREDQIPPERKREALHFIIDRTDHLARLVEDLFLSASISREGANHLPEVQRQRVDVGTLMENVVAPFRLAHPHREIVISQDRPMTVVADPLRAEQMIGQVVSNALK